MVLLPSTHGSEKATTVPSVAPKIVVQDKEYSRAKLSLRTTALDLLKIKLGKDAYLLDHIPLSKVSMVKGNQMFPLSPYRICVGLDKVQSQNQSCKISAFIAEKARQDGSVEIKFYGEDKDGKMHQHSCEKMDRSGQWLDMFDIGTKSKTIVLIKCYLALKGVPLPKDLTFSDSFLTTLKRICRYYLGRSKSNSPPSVCERARSIVLSPPAYKGAMMARKSEPCGPRGQTFSLRPTAFAQTSDGGKDKKAVQVENGSPVASAEVPVVGGALDQKKSDVTNKHRPVVHAPMPKVMKVPGSPRKSSATRSQATGDISQPVSSIVSVNTEENKTAFAVRSPKVRSNSQKSFKQLSARPVTFVSAAPQDKPVTTKAPQPEVHTHGQQASTTGLAGYQTLQGQMVEIEDTLERIESTAQENKRKYDRLRDNKKHDIDVMMRERHKIEIGLMLEQLEQKHKAERAAEKTEYDSLVEEYRSHKETIEKQRGKAMQRREAAKEDLKRKREGLSRKDLLDCLDACDERHRSQKRRKP
ncbi:uncharacterized protein EKO05_0002753 [Ascochyta rabiei]|uniref:Uncharacterized protein n=1 Tax=Didymella rabiei TaxID=5454 RepID=A0A162YP09_DIDRA|nr:uncharacterized protein EKO05_0002753 [Ascochyta rabiei]KZM20143.1 hypothetical protein ST47_g8729 [Ascochyta rabiei]UPX12190.1 hypothetical protein EKO05_0002753 [Ascochyta rabiei]